MMYVTAVVLAAGLGLRFKAKVSKPLAEINSMPVIIYCLLTFNKHPLIKDIIVVGNPDNSEALAAKIRQYRIGKIKGIVEGGERRQDSVYNGLKAIDNRTSLVLIHDAARPFIDKKTVSSLLEEARRSGAAIAGMPVKATIKKCAAHSAQRTVKKTIDRRGLWEIQTPQVFRKNLILKAYKKFGHIDVTDDAGLVEKLGVKVNVVLGSDRNIKITTYEDLILAEAILKTHSAKRIAHNG